MFLKRPQTSFLTTQCHILDTKYFKKIQGLLVYISNFTKLSKLHRVGKGKSKAFVTKIAILHPLKGHVHSSAHAHFYQNAVFLPAHAVSCMQAI